MKKAATLLILVTMIVLSIQLRVFAQNTAQYTVKNMVQNAANSVSFDVYVKNTNATASWQYTNSSLQIKYTSGFLGASGTPGGSVTPSSNLPASGLSAAAVFTTVGLIKVTSMGGLGYAGPTLTAGSSILLYTVTLTSTVTFAGSPGFVYNTPLATASKVFSYNGGSGSAVTIPADTLTGFVSLLSNSPLPVELATFTSNNNGRDVNLLWKTVKEINNSGFDIERKSIVDNTWTKIGFVRGSGNTNNTVTYNYTDSKLNAGKYSYRLKQIDYNGNYEYFSLNNDVQVGVPVKFDLSQNYPNPFNPVTKIDYQLPGDSRVSIKLYDEVGKEVMTLVNDKQSAGYYTISLNASNLSSGAYFYRITAGSFVMTKKLMIVK